MVAVLVIGADYSRGDAVRMLASVEAFFRAECMTAPADTAAAVGLALRSANRAGMVELLRGLVWKVRCCRRESVFNFDSTLGNQRAGFAIMARLVLGVMRHEVKR